MSAQIAFASVVGMINYSTLDVLKNRMRCVDVRAVKILYDFGPDKEPERSAWLRETGGKPQQLALNAGVEANEVLTRSRGRFRESLNAAVEENIAEPGSVGQVVVNLVAQSGAQLGGHWLLDIISGNKYVVFSPDYIEWQSRDLRYQPTSPS
jgi:hypothetical protein